MRFPSGGWLRLIKQVYEVDPSVCPRCAGPMRNIAVVEQPEVIDLPVPGTCLRATHRQAKATGRQSPQRRP